MAELSGRTLMMAVQAVQATIRDIRGDSEIADLDPDDQEMLVSYSTAAEELRKAYIEASHKASNLPPYEHLVPGLSGIFPRG